MSVLYPTNGHPKHIASVRMCDLIVWSHGADGLDDSTVHRKMRLPSPSSVPFTLKKEVSIID